MDVIECPGFCLVMGGNEGETEGLRVWGQLNSNLLEMGSERGGRRFWMSRGFNKGRAGTDQASVQVFHLCPTGLCLAARSSRCPSHPTAPPVP